MLKGSNSKMKIYNSKTGKIQKWYPKKFITNMLILIGVLIGIWFLVSYIQIILHQSDFLKNGTHFVYPNWNIFTWLNNHFNWLSRC